MSAKFCVEMFTNIYSTILYHIYINIDMKIESAGDFSKKTNIVENDKFMFRDSLLKDYEGQSSFFLVSITYPYCFLPNFDQVKI